MGKKTIVALLPLPRQRVVWYSLARWQPTIITEMNHALLPLDDEGEDKLYDERPQVAGVKRPWRASPADEVTIYSTRHLMPSSYKVLYAVDRSLWRVKGSLGPLGVIQNPHAYTRCGGWDHVPSLPNYIKGSHVSMVQQIDAQLHQHSQVAECAVCLAFHRGAQV